DDPSPSPTGCQAALHGLAGREPPRVGGPVRGAVPQPRVSPPRLVRPPIRPEGREEGSRGGTARTALRLRSGQHHHRGADVRPLVEECGVVVGLTDTPRAPVLAQVVLAL